jgi:hypothetical protein
MDRAAALQLDYLARPDGSPIELVPAARPLYSIEIIFLIVFEACPYHLSHPAVLVMKSADKRDGHERSSRLDRTAERGVLRESEMSTGTIVVVSVGPEDPAEMRFA